MSTSGTLDALKPYAAYEDSGLPWLGRVPAHWTLRRAKYLYREVDDRSATGDEELMSVSHLTGVTPRRAKNVTMFLAQSNVGHKLCQPGDLVINTMWAWMAALGVAAQVGLVSPSYGVYRPLASNNLLPRYADRLLRTAAYASEYTCRSTGINSSRLRLYPDEFLRVPLLSPPVSDQTAIVQFLSHVDRRIGRYVRAQRTLVKLLGEQKRAIIHRAITRGLDPNVRLKPSGVESVGDVPEHWEVLALKRILRRLIDCEHKTAPAVDASEYRVVRTSAVRNGSLCLEGTYCTTASAYEEWTRRGVPEPGDVIFTREAPAGEACIVPSGQALCLGQRTVLMKLRPSDYHCRYLVHMIYAGPPHVRIQLASQGSTVGHFNMDDIGWMQVLRPLLDEQVEISNWIEDNTRTLDTAIARADAEISLLREYRTRLIADVVTGKLDVRDIAARLSDEDVEAEELPLAEEALDVAEDTSELSSEEVAEEEVVA